MNALVVSAVVRDADIHVVDRPRYVTQRKKFAKKWGEGVALRLRVEPEEDAVTYGQFKFYFGRIIGPFVEHTGYRQDECHLMFKAQFMPDGKHSITQLNHDEMRDYMQACEQWARETVPDAFLLYDNGRV